ncbi:helix-turn-helix domain-containing protein [Labrenzia sp. R4_2]|uniref:helix-turn-helix domain-containing protein n=1 Tax=Labrenzia sp. R4_2 TaxID=2821107 RepID=UPI001ADC0B23|nr:helix-turn-helix domain-containing protein [Labrenzia sp. R4_2]MBO9422336.1 helix-turn-helix domain-containing protein [Labrenzia sp. R4_2]
MSNVAHFPGAKMSADHHKVQYSDKVEWIGKVGRDRNLTDGDKVVAVVFLKFFFSVTGIAWPNIDTLAQETGKSPRTVIRAIHALEREGYIEVDRNRGRGRNNQYVFVHTSGCKNTAEKRDTGVTSKDQKGDKCSTKTCQTLHKKGDAGVTQNKEKEINIKKQTRAPAREAERQVPYRPALRKHPPPWTTQYSLWKARGSSECEGEFISVDDPRFPCLAKISPDQAGSPTTIFDHHGQHGCMFFKKDIEHLRAEGDCPAALGPS